MESAKILHLNTVLRKEIDNINCPFVIPRVSLEIPVSLELQDYQVEEDYPERM